MSDKKALIGGDFHEQVGNEACAFIEGYDEHEIG